MKTIIEQIEDALMDGPGTIAEIELEIRGRTDREAMAKVLSALQALEMRNAVDIWAEIKTPHAQAGQIQRRLATMRRRLHAMSPPERAELLLWAYEQFSDVEVACKTSA